MDRDSQASADGPISRWLSTAQPEALFVLSAVAQYVGAAFWPCCCSTARSEGRRRRTADRCLVPTRSALPSRCSPCHAAGAPGWTRPQLIGVAVFGVTTALMNICFYLAIDRIDLGKGVTIEFIGPIAVAACHHAQSSGTVIALPFAIVGVVVLGGVEVADNLARTRASSSSRRRSGPATSSSGSTGRPGRPRRRRPRPRLVRSARSCLAPVGAPWKPGPVWLSARHFSCCACRLVGVFSNAIGYGIDQFTMRRIPIRRFLTAPRAPARDRIS